MAMNVLVATDGSDHSMKAVVRALEMAERENANVTLMSVAFYAKEDLDEMPLNIQERLESQAQIALKKAKAPLQCPLRRPYLFLAHLTIAL